MAQIITFENYRPSARYDDIAWTAVRVQEAATAAGPWTLIDTVALDPVDDNPEVPAERNITTEEASDTAGLWYRLVFVDASGDTSQPTRPVRNGLPDPSDRDLCSLDDIYGYVPAYRPEDNNTDAKLQQFITAQSELIMGAPPGGCSREIVGRDSSPAARDFEIDADAARTGRIDIGDLSAIDDDDFEVALIPQTGGAGTAVDTDTIVALYEGLYRSTTAPWEPVTSLLFDTNLGAPTLTAGYVLRVTGTWGFPEVPAFIREACAARVILRYINDVAGAGDDFAEALDSVDTAALFRNSEDAIESLRKPVIA